MMLVCMYVCVFFFYIYLFDNPYYFDNVICYDVGMTVFYYYYYDNLICYKNMLMIVPYTKYICLCLNKYISFINSLNIFIYTLNIFLFYVDTY